MLGVALLPATNAAVATAAEIVTYAAGESACRLSASRRQAAQRSIASRPPATTANDSAVARSCRAAQIAAPHVAVAVSPTITVACSAKPRELQATATNTTAATSATAAPNARSNC